MLSHSRGIRHALNFSGSIVTLEHDRQFFEDKLWPSERHVSALMLPAPIIDHHAQPISVSPYVTPDPTGAPLSETCIDASCGSAQDLPVISTPASAPTAVDRRATTDSGTSCPLAAKQIDPTSAPDATKPKVNTTTR